VSAILLLVIRILMAVILYGFFGLAIYTLLCDLKQQGDLLAARQPPPLTLTSITVSHATPYKFIKPEIILGRETTCDFHLDDQTVSSQHARLTYHNQQWWLEDLASTNGTFLNDEAVTAPVVITHGDKLRLGQLSIKIEINRSE
jgi:FHA domain